MLEALSARAQIAARQKRHADGLVDCNRALARYPRAWDVYLIRGNIRMDRKELDEAIVDFDQAIRLRPRSKMGYTNRGLAYLRRRSRSRLPARVPGSSG